MRVDRLTLMAAWRPRSPHAPHLEALETLRVVDYDLPVAASSRILIFTRPTPAALAVLRKLGLRLPKQLTLPVAA